MSSAVHIAFPLSLADDEGWHHVAFHWIDGDHIYYLDNEWIPTAFVDMELEADRYARRSLPAPSPDQPESATPEPAEEPHHGED